MMGPLLTVLTIRLALVGYFLGLACLVLASRYSHWGIWARRYWVAGCGLYLLHVVCAFHFFYDWSHTAAYSATAEESAQIVGRETGFGIYFNYLFTLVWLLDVLWWLRNGTARYMHRSRAITIALHLFMGFMVLNGAVVFAAGWLRWLSLAGFLLAGALFVWLRKVRSTKSVTIQ